MTQCSHSNLTLMFAKLCCVRCVIRQLMDRATVSTLSIYRHDINSAAGRYCKILFPYKAIDYEEIQCKHKAAGNMSL